jgi:hypothetical protein
MAEDDRGQPSGFAQLGYVLADLDPAGSGEY